MKHLPLLLLSSFAMMASAGHPPHPAKTPFTGFSVIAEAGGIAGKADLEQDLQGRISGSVNIDYANEARIPESGATGAVGVAYAHQFQNGVVLSGLFTAGFDYLTFEGEVNATTGSPGFVTGFNQGRLTTELRNDIALLFKPGFAFHNTLVYGLVGPRWGNFKSTFENQLTITLIGSPPTLLADLPSHADQSAYHMGIAVGAGLSQKLWSHWIIGVEYQYTAYGNDIASFQTSNNTTAATPILSKVAGYVANATVDHVSTNTLMATVAYQF